MIYYSPEGSFITVVGLIILYFLYKKGVKAGKKAEIRYIKDKLARGHTDFNLSEFKYINADDIKKNIPNADFVTPAELELSKKLKQDYHNTYNYNK